MKILRIDYLVGDGNTKAPMPGFCIDDRYLEQFPEGVVVVMSSMVKLDEEKILYCGACGGKGVVGELVSRKEPSGMYVCAGCTGEQS